MTWEERLKMAQGYAIPITVQDAERDNHGYTNPNLHRRINIHAALDEGETKQKEITLEVRGVNSYRLTKTYTRDDDTDTSEIP